MAGWARHHEACWEGRARLAVVFPEPWTMELGERPTGLLRKLGPMGQVSAPLVWADEVLGEDEGRNTTELSSCRLRRTEQLRHTQELLQAWLGNYVDLGWVPMIDAGDDDREFREINDRTRTVLGDCLTRSQLADFGVLDSAGHWSPSPSPRPRRSWVTFSRY